MTHSISHNAAASFPVVTPLRSFQASSASTASDTSGQANFAEVFGAAADARGPVTTSDASARTAHVEALAPTVTIAAAAAVTAAATSATTTTATTSTGTGTTTTGSTTTDDTTTGTTTGTKTTTAVTTTTATDTSVTLPSTTTPGIQALVTAIQSGALQASYVSDPTKLQETTPVGTDYMPSMYYASDQTAAQIAQLLGGTVVQMKAFGQAAGYTEPNANFIQLSNGMTFNAADVAYYALHAPQSAAQLTADLTQTINAGSAWTSYMQGKTGMPATNPIGYIGPPIPGMVYPASMIGADGNVINPSMQA